MARDLVGPLAYDRCTVMARLAPCPSCDRHVRIDEAACPFCGSALPRTFGAGPVPAATSSPGLGRGVLFHHARVRVAVGTSLLVVAACSSTSSAQPIPLYGAPPPVVGPCGEIEWGAECSCRGLYYPMPDSGTGTAFFCSGNWEFGDEGTLLTASNCAACAPDAGPPKDSGARTSGDASDANADSGR